MILKNGYNSYIMYSHRLRVLYYWLRSMYNTVRVSSHIYRCSEKISLALEHEYESVLLLQNWIKKSFPRLYRSPAICYDLLHF